jgi:hypothetical protein
MDLNRRGDRQGPAARSFTRRLGAIVAGSTILFLVVAPSALAGQPDRSPQVYPDHIDLAAGDSCDFAVRLDILENREVNEVITLGGGRWWVQTTGRLLIRIVNVDTGANVTRNVSGPARTYVVDDGSQTSHLFGQSLLFWPGTLLQTSGPIVLRTAPDGTVLSSSGIDATAEDLCAELG